MARIFYSLRISIDTNVSKQMISELLEFEPNMDDLFWGIEKCQNEEDPFFDYPSFFAEKIGYKIDELEKLGIYTKNISIWLIYEYDNQCNLEFQPNTLKVIGELGITLCISCYSSTL